ncbi:MAG: SRPBCC domain-containing protein [Candidatus Baltobacteraceae bacterium]
MTETHAPVVPALVLRRTYKAPRERVFSAWTTPETAVRFLGPGDVTIPEIHMDARTGGSYRITMLKADGERLLVSGVYREVIAPARLSMTWRWEEDNPAEEYDSLLTLEFNDLGGETELILTHAQIATAQSRDNHEHGWTAILDKLPDVL